MDQPSRARRSRFLRAVVLTIIWLQVATANMAACAFGVEDSDARGSQTHAASDHHMPPPNRAITPGPDCGGPALLVMDYIAPSQPEQPETIVVPLPHIVGAVTVMVSTALQIDPPPPRA